MTVVDFGQFRLFVLSVLFCFVCFVSTDLFGFLIYWLWDLIFWLWVPIFLKLDINVRITCSTWIKAVCCKALDEHNILNILLWYCIYLSNGREGGVGVFTALKFPAETFDYIYIFWWCFRMYCYCFIYSWIV
jgi:hypothetical protein